MRKAPNALQTEESIPLEETRHLTPGTFLEEINCSVVFSSFQFFFSFSLVLARGANKKPGKLNEGPSL